MTSDELATLAEQQYQEGDKGLAVVLFTLAGARAAGPQHESELLEILCAYNEESVARLTHELNARMN